MKVQHLLLLRTPHTSSCLSGRVCLHGLWSSCNWNTDLNNKCSMQNLHDCFNCSALPFECLTNGWSDHHPHASVKIFQSTCKKCTKNIAGSNKNWNLDRAHKGRHMHEDDVAVKRIFSLEFGPVVSWSASSSRWKSWTFIIYLIPL